MENAIPCPDLKRSINRSIETGVQAYNWVPPEWPENASPPKLEDNAGEEGQWPVFKFPSEQYPRRETESVPGEEAPPAIVPEGKKHGFKKYVHPDSDFSHEDPTETGRKIPKEQFEKLQKIIHETPIGMQRLACVFEWVLVNAYRILGDINIALGKGRVRTEPSRTKYIEARERYIGFLKDLDERDARAHGRKVEPGVAGRSGYGKAMKWAFIFPVIHKGAFVGAKVVVKWNPHSSSNGIPIEHP